MLVGSLLRFKKGFCEFINVTDYDYVYFVTSPYLDVCIKDFTTLFEFGRIKLVSHTYLPVKQELPQQCYCTD